MKRTGAILIVLGWVFLGNNFGPLQWGWLHQWWPPILIGVGAWSLLNHRPGDRHRSQGADK